MVLRISRKGIVNFIFWIMTVVCFFRFKAIAACHLYIFVGCFFLYIILMLLDSKKRADLTNYLYLIVSFILGIIFYFMSGNPSNNNIFYHVLFFSLPVFYYTVAQEYMQALGKDIFIENIIKFCPLYVIYLAIEVVWRFWHAASTMNSYLAYKTNSFATSDSNFLALMILAFWCLLRFIYKKTGDARIKKYLILFIIFEILTISRGVIVTQICLLYIEYCLRQRKRGNYLIDILNMIVFPLVGTGVYTFFLNDASFRSKVTIFKGITRVFNYELKYQLFGFGYGMGEYMYSYRVDDYGHLHIALLIGQIGIIGLLLFLCWLMRILFISHKNTMIITIAFIISGFSLAFIDSSLFYCIAGIYAIGKEYENKPRRKREFYFSFI